MANYVYGAISLTGGTTGSLDSIDGSNLSNLDGAIVFTDTTFYLYTLDEDSGAAESSPGIIAPDTNAGNKRWVLLYSRANDNQLDTSSFGAILSSSQSDVQSALALIDDMMNSDDFTVSTGSVSLDDDVGKAVATDSGAATPSSHQLTFAGSGKINTAGSGATVTISIDDLAAATKTSGPYTILATDDIVIGDTAGGSFAFTLPAASAKSLIRVIKKSNSNILTINRAGGDLIEGSTSVALRSEGEIITLVSDGSATWTIESPIIKTSAFNGVLSTNQDTLQKALETLDDMFATADFTVSEGSVAVKDSGVDHDEITNTHNLTTDIDHGSISGRSDDDHSQYSLVAGSRAFTGTIGGVTPTAAAHLATKEYVDGLVNGLDWQDSVLDRVAIGGATATTGNRYLATATGGGWTFNNIYEYNGSSWDETVASEGMTVWVEDENLNYTYNGSIWVRFGTTVSHNDATGLNNGDYKHLTATEKTKFDGIEDNAKDDQTATEILNLLKTVDGTGSGLDADLLDGIDSANVVVTNANRTVSAHLTFADNYFCYFGSDNDMHLTHSGAAGWLVSNLQDAHFYISANNGGTIRTYLDVDAAADVTKIRNPQTNSGDAIWHEGNDGAASSLDAGLLAGQSPSYYRNAGNLNAGILPAARFDDTAHGSRGGAALHAIATAGAHGFMSSTDKSKLDLFAAASAYVRSNADDTISAHTEWQDGYSARFGTDADMRIYHNGSNAYIETHTGTLNFNNASAQSLMRITAAAIALYHTGSARLQTTATGVQIGNGTLWSGDLEYGQVAPAGTTALGYNGYFYATRVYNAVYNDIADFQDLDDELVYGKCYIDTLSGAKIASQRCQKSVMGIASDTYGFGVGADDKGKKAPFAIGGWTLAFCDQTYDPGTPLTNDDQGNLTEMSIDEKRDFPERIVAIYKKPESEEFWGPEDDPVTVNGRHWVKVK